MTDGLSIAVVLPHLVVGGLACNMRSVMKRADRNMISDVVEALQARPLRPRWGDEGKGQAPPPRVGRAPRQARSQWRGGPPERPRSRIGVRQAARLLARSAAQAQGISSSRREAGQRLTSLVRTSVR